MKAPLVRTRNRSGFQHFWDLWIERHITGGAELWHRHDEYRKILAPRTPGQSVAGIPHHTDESLFNLVLSDHFYSLLLLKMWLLKKGKKCIVFSLHAYTGIILYNIYKYTIWSNIDIIILFFPFYSQVLINQGFSRGRTLLWAHSPFSLFCE